MDGKSFGDLVRQPDSRANHGPVFAEYNVGTASAKYMIREGNYKYVYWVNDIAELYDLQADPQELRNLAGEPAHRPVVDRLRQRLLAWHTPAEKVTK